MMIGELIAKEELPNYKIIPAPVDHSELLKDKLEGALRLGNAFKSKTTIVFQTEDGPKRIETTIWSVTDKYLQIKSGVLIPLKSVLGIEY
ncbi:hypothetical protein ACR78F_04460 [Sphingobacterium spiritivorum]|uniref:Uncharacterized protein n=3 Tax=Sphingobacterium spiritivorum TaxID=258 RepID=D7VQ19_SPHSI|nr:MULTISPECIES: hypothetical protein [Sphingobacterium]EEI90315.1 hypothetical protein HMPREF0765_4266 [Sphingobacterium spiritivorum ATCC 33300]EFK55870.1 hypothetical protein HMPREF0766_13073 [Sphingobacterium spiritivorum ATCC 33861]QQS95063.1 hypothetical protein I6J03_17020 [Sphingobacterium spiritivorum]QQT26310.1 hypothetical protein I6J02_00195 [Sphingobacterium spiritivorum]QQT35992.1 hypothetical protein I6J01_00790 [Sphingobacterium spiritivorum]